MTPSAKNAGETLLDQIVDGWPGTYAMICRNDSTGAAQVEIFIGTQCRLDSLRELDQLLEGRTGQQGTDVIVVVPYRQVLERGFQAVDDDAALLALAVDDRQVVTPQALLARLPDVGVCLENAQFDSSDDEYAETVARVIRDEIGRGEGANFVIRRSLVGTLRECSPETVLGIFGNLLRQESGAYWTFLIRTKELTLVGASPERHITVHDGMVTMTPVSGTYRFPASGPTRDGLVAFLTSAKEENELFMVVDEELKMMAGICAHGLRADGPYLTTMANLVHTGYVLRGRSQLALSEILTRSMFAPTVTGSPLENAARVIAHHENTGRSYYSGFIATVGRDSCGLSVDSSILIRTAEIDRDGRVRIGVGATLVRDSDPASEAGETAAKALALQRAMGATPTSWLTCDPLVSAVLGQRNQRMSRFWLDGQDENQPVDRFGDNEVAALIVDNEDTFTSMIRYQLAALNVAVRVRGYRDEIDPKPGELLVMGPGPGDPRDSRDPRIALTRDLMSDALDEGRPFLAVCLSHQILCGMLGCAIAMLPQPNQGLQRKIPFFGVKEIVGFYNTFTAVAGQDELSCRAGPVAVARDTTTGHVFGLRGPGFASLQFHAESVLTVDGPRILREAIVAAVQEFSVRQEGR